MVGSLPQQILRRVRGRGRGAVFTAADFLDLGKRAAVDQALSRLTRQGTIRRVSRGVYDLPKVHVRLGPLTPKPDAVVQAIARQSHRTVVPSGAYAANALGLSTQVPGRVEYWTDGPTRTLQLGRQRVTLRHVQDRFLVCDGTPAGMAVTALHFLGQDGTSAEVVDRLGRALGAADKRRLRANARVLPRWMQATVQSVSRL